jgi:hypothetical protein
MKSCDLILQKNELLIFLVSSYIFVAFVPQSPILGIALVDVYTLSDPQRTFNG